MSEDDDTPWCTKHDRPATYENWTGMLGENAVVELLCYFCRKEAG